MQLLQTKLECFDWGVFIQCGSPALQADRAVNRQFCLHPFDFTSRLGRLIPQASRFGLGLCCLAQLGRNVRQQFAEFTALRLFDRRVIVQGLLQPLQVYRGDIGTEEKQAATQQCLERAVLGESFDP